MEPVIRNSGRRQILAGSAASLIAAPAIIRSARAQSPVTWKVQSHYTRATGSFDASVGTLGKLLSEQTGGKFRLEPLGAGELAKGSEIFNIVRRGVVPMGTLAPDYNVGESELLGFYAGIPGAARNTWELMHLTKNLGLEKELNKQLLPKGVFMMGINAYPTELVLKKKLEHGANLSSIKIRSSGNLLEFLGKVGFAPQLIDGSEIYQALATGVVDGAHWGGTFTTLTSKLWEVAPVHMKPAISIANTAFIVNQNAYEKLPQNFQMILTSLLEERYFQRSIEYLHMEEISLRTGIEKLGVTVDTFPDEILEKFSGATHELLKKEMEKGPKAREYGEKLTSLMKDLGYT